MSTEDREMLVVFRKVMVEIVVPKDVATAVIDGVKESEECEIRSEFEGPEGTHIPILVRIAAQSSLYDHLRKVCGDTRLSFKDTPVPGE